ncbi:MAG: RNA polymerase sigma factor [Thermomicrobiales bacterium]
MVVVTMGDSLMDDALVSGMAAGGAEALACFEAFYDRHHRPAFALAYRIMSGDHALAEDVVQESFLALWRYAASFKPERGNARTWFFSIVHHRALNAVRRLKPQMRSEPIDQMAAELPAGDAYDVWSQVRRGLDATQVRAALALLPADQQEAVELAFLGGYSNSEVAERLGIPLGTVKSRIRLGMHKMRATLAPATREHMEA